MNHWAMAVVNIDKQTLSLYDSMREQVNGRGGVYLQNLLNYLEAEAGEGSSSRPIYPGRPSQEMREPPKEIIPFASLNQEVKLHTVENAWKPVVGAKKPVESGQDEEAKTVLLLKNFRGFLNKITPQKYDVIEGKIKELTIDTEDRLEKVMNLVFDKAVAEPAFCKQYAQLCQHLGLRHVTKLVVNKEGQEVEEKVEFRRLLIQKCQQGFERAIYEGIDVVGRMEDIEECINEVKKRQLEHELEEEKRRARQKSLGNMKLIGELYRLQILKAVIMVNCIHKLISEIGDNNLECLCTLLRTIGQQLEIETQDTLNSDSLGRYFTRLNTIVNSPELGKTISVRVKFLIKDILDLKSNKWQGPPQPVMSIPSHLQAIGVSHSQNAAPQAGAAAGSGAAGPGSSAGQMMHPSGGQMVQNQANQPQPQSYQNVPPQQAIRTAFGSQQPVAQNRPVMLIPSHVQAISVSHSNHTDHVTLFFVSLVACDVSIASRSECRCPATSPSPLIVMMCACAVIASARRQHVIPL